jgi:hypothetical protein
MANIWKIPSKFQRFGVYFMGTIVDLRKAIKYCLKTLTFLEICIFCVQIVWKPMKISPYLGFRAILDKDFVLKPYWVVP